MRDVLRMLVPRSWSGEQALLAARVLRAALDAVWAVHGEEMALALGDQPIERWYDAFPEDEVPEDDDIPF